MAKKKDTKQDKKKKSTRYSDYPIGVVFQISTLAAAVAFVLFYLKNPNDVALCVFRAFLVFTLFAVGGGLIIITAFTILAGIRQKELEAALEEHTENLRKQFEEGQAKQQESL
jgi:hypothetical protein